MKETWPDRRCDALRQKVAALPLADVCHCSLVFCAHRTRILIRAAVDEARREEREACAALCDGAAQPGGQETYPRDRRLAAALRDAILARSEPKP